jgi:hypothetical protein
VCVFVLYTSAHLLVLVVLLLLLLVVVPAVS